MFTVPLVPRFKIPFDLLFPVLIYVFWRFGAPRMGLRDAHIRCRALWRLTLLPLFALFVVAIRLRSSAGAWSHSVYLGLGPFHSSGLGRHVFSTHGPGSNPWPFWIVATVVLIRTTGMAFALIMGATEYVMMALRIRRMPRTEVSPGVNVLHVPGWIAFSFGLLRPRVFVSDDVYNSAHREAVLAHEREHVRRRDPLARVVSRAAERVLWYLPFWGYITDQFELATEVACDAEASRAVGKATYAGALLAFTTYSSAQLGCLVAQFGEDAGCLITRARVLARNDDGVAPSPLFWPVFCIVYVLLVVLS